MYKILLNVFYNMIELLTRRTVNSCCASMFGQPEEPESLMRFKVNNHV